MRFNPSSTEDDAPTYVYVAVGSGVGIVVYILTIVLIGLVISLKIKGGYSTFTNCQCTYGVHVLKYTCTEHMYIQHIHTGMICTFYVCTYDVHMYVHMNAIQ